MQRVFAPKGRRTVRKTASHTAFVRPPINLDSLSSSNDLPSLRPTIRLRGLDCFFLGSSNSSFGYPLPSSKARMISRDLSLNYSCSFLRAARIVADVSSCRRRFLVGSLRIQQEKGILHRHGVFAISINCLRSQLFDPL